MNWKRKALQETQQPDADPLRFDVNLRQTYCVRLWGRQYELATDCRALLLVANPVCVRPIWPKRRAKDAHAFFDAPSCVVGYYALEQVREWCGPMRMINCYNCDGTGLDPDAVEFAKDNDLWVDKADAACHLCADGQHVEYRIGVWANRRWAINRLARLLQHMPPCHVLVECAPMAGTAGDAMRIIAPDWQLVLMQTLDEQDNMPVLGDALYAKECQTNEAPVVRFRGRRIR